MAETNGERRGRFRVQPRPGRRVELRYQLIEPGESAPSWLANEPQRAFTKNIGFGGAFIVTPDPAPPGTLLHVLVHLPTVPTPVEIAAEVRWIVDGGRDESVADFGMGVRFGQLTADGRRRLHEYFASLTCTVDYDEV